MKKKLLAIIATAAMVVTMIPAMAFADSNVAKIGDTGYATFAEAIAAANESTSDVTIELKTDNEISGSLIIENVNGKTITINGDGYKLSPAQDANFTKNYAIAVKSPLNINGLNVDGIVKDNKTFHIIDLLKGDVTIKDSKFNNNKINSSYGSIIKLGLENQLYTGSVKIQSTEFKNNIAPSGVISEDKGSSVYSVVIDDCDFVENNISNSSAPVVLAGAVTITNNEFIDNKAYGKNYAAGGVYAWGTSATITGNTFSGNDVYIKEGKVGSTAIIATTKDNNIDLSGNTVLDDGTVNVKGNESGQYEKTDSVAIFVRDKGTAVAEISSGNISGKIETDTTEETPNIEITGGTFDSDVNEYLAEGAVVLVYTDDDDNTLYGVYNDEAAAVAAGAEYKVGDTYYSDYDKACAAANGDEESITALARYIDFILLPPNVKTGDEIPMDQWYQTKITEETSLHAALDIILGEGMEIPTYEGYTLVWSLADWDFDKDNEKEIFKNYTDIVSLDTKVAIEDGSNYSVFAKWVPKAVEDLDSDEGTEDATDTGDDMNMAIPFAIAGLALIAMAALVLARRKVS